MKNQNFLSLAFFAILLSVVSCKNDSANNQSTTADPAAAGTVANPGDVANPAGEATPAAPTGPTTTVEYETMVYDFGEVKEGEHVKYSFKFKNTGSEPLVISDAKGSCGCTVPEWPKDAIAPGKSGEIKVVFDSKGKGAVGGKEDSKRVTVTANTDPVDTYLTIKGKVDKKEDAAGK